MEVELGQVAAGLPMAISVALAGGITTLREGRRRTALNEAMHELRRPLQVMSLSLPPDPGRAEALESSLQMAAAALDRLDWEINGGSGIAAHRPLELASLLGTTVERWRAQAARSGRSLQLRCEVPDGVVLGAEVQISQALDNMISNAIEHGSGTVLVEARGTEGRIRVAVLDGGSVDRGGGSNPDLRARLDGRHRHGHGLRVIARVARAHQGTFCLRRSSIGTEARLELPLRCQGASA